MKTWGPAGPKIFSEIWALLRFHFYWTPAKLTLYQPVDLKMLHIVGGNVQLIWFTINLQNKSSYKFIKTNLPLDSDDKCNSVTND